MAERSFADIFIEQIEEAGDEAYKLIEKFIKEARAEDLYLDFKEKEDRTKAAISINDERNLGKAISGFAHSDSGIIVWGIEARRKGNDSESPDVARSLKPIKNLNAFHANLNNKVRVATTPPVPGVRNFKIQKRPKAKEGYVVTYVPVGPVPPYRAERCNNHFYKRSGSNFYHMEPFDLRDIVLRGNYPKITLDFDWTKIRSLKDGQIHLHELILRISNAGPTVLDTWKLVIEYSRAISAWGISGVNKSMGVVYSQFSGPDNGIWDRFVINSQPHRMSSGDPFHPVLPEENLSILNVDGPYHFYYQMYPEVWRQGGRKIYWRFYGANIPAQRGEILVGPNSFCDF